MTVLNTCIDLCIENEVVKVTSFSMDLCIALL